MSRLQEIRRSSHVLRVMMLTAAIGGFGAPAALAQDQAGATAQVIDADFIKERGGTARINLSAKLRMLSQRITAEACIYATHANDEVAAKDLTAALDEFDRIVAALEVGDESLGILGAEDSAKIIKGLKVLAEEWAPMGAAARDLITLGGDNAADVAVIYEQEPKVLKIAQKLATEVGAIYTDPKSVSVASAMAIDIAGRQRMLLQEMVKEACQISTGAGTAETPAKLEASLGTFDATLAALIQGMPEAGVPPPPTPEIRAELEAVKATWQTVRAPIDSALSGTMLDAPAMSTLLVSTDELMKELNHVVGDYADAATY
jgi:hypothetical protein